jgi:hypothetical protein
MIQRLIQGAALLIVAATGVSALADGPSADYIFPAGGQQGTTVQFRVGASFLHGGAPFEMSGGGLEASSRIERTETTWFEGPMIFKPASQGGENYPKDHLGTVAIDADAEPGARHWHIRTSQGVTPSRSFMVGTLPEIVEEEIDGIAIPIKISLPVTINGRMFPREDVDIWEFEAEQGQSVTCEVHAARIGSPLDSHLEVRGPAGQLVAENADCFETDSFLRFTAPKTGSYHVRLHDSSFRGLQNFVYRLTVTSRTYVDRVFPLGGQAGSKVAFQLHGQQVPDEPSVFHLPDAHSADQWVCLPTGASLSNPVLIALSDVDEHIEHEPNDSPQIEDGTSVPTVFNGRIDKPGDVDSWTFVAQKDQELVFDLATQRYGSPLDGVITISDAAGNQLKQVGSSYDNPVEPTAALTVPADGVYVVSVKSYSGEHGGPEYAYRLQVGPPRSPDFQLRLPSDAITVMRGSESKFKISVERVAGFDQEIAVTVNGLPSDVTADSVTIATGKKDAELVFKATKTAKIRAAQLSVEGVAKIAGESLVRRATLPGPRGAQPRDAVQLAVGMPTPFKLDGKAFKTSYAARGTIHRRHFVIHRNDYRGPLTLRLADRQIRHLQGVTGRIVEVPPEIDEVQYPIQIPTWLEMNRTSRTVVMAVGEVEDEQGVMHKVSFSSGVPRDQIILLTAPSPFSVRTARRSIRATPGETLQLDVTLARGVLPTAPITVELVLPKHMHGVEADEVRVPADQSTGVLTLRFQRPLGPFNMPAVVRATTIVGGDPVVAEAEIEFADVATRRSGK